MRRLDGKASRFQNVLGNITEYSSHQTNSCTSTSLAMTTSYLQEFIMKKTFAELKNIDWFHELKLLYRFDEMISLGTLPYFTERSEREDYCE